jgi:peptide/nickel transport system permease protein
MARFVLRRLAGAIPLLLLISIMTFSLVIALPGDPALTIAGDSASEQRLEAIRERLGENDPILTRYAEWIGNAVQGDFGSSLFSETTVASAIWQRTPVTVSLTIVALAIALLVALPVGLLAGLRPGSAFDRLMTIGASTGAAVPSFWLGLLLSVIFAVKLGWFPAIGYVSFTEDPWEWLRHMMLPGLSLGLASAATLTRQLRSSVISVMQQDYIRTATAKGLRRRTVVLKHLLKNASIPAVTSLGLQVPLLLSGTVIIEGLFSLNGVGQYVISAVLLRDLPVVQAVVLLSATIVVLTNLLVDVSYGYLNPKTRLQ